MSPEAITELLLQYRYWILIPLSFVEGPVIAFVAGTFAAVGFFNLYGLAVLFFVRDMVLDAACYAVGYFGGRTAFAERMLTKIGITDDHLANVKKVWEKKAFITMFIGKLSYGIAGAFIVAAGKVEMPLRQFFGYGAIVAIIQYWGLLLVGYFLGESLGGTATKIVENSVYVVGVLALAITVYYLVAWKIRTKFMAQDKEIESQPPDDISTV